MNRDEQGPVSKLLADLYPNLSQQELAESENNLQAYLAVVKRVYERIHADPEAYSEFQVLTGSGRSSTMQGKGQINN